MDVIGLTWEKIVNTAYAARFSPMHSLLFRFGLWFLLALLLFTLAWNRGIKNSFLNVIVFYVATTTVFSINFYLLRKLCPQLYLFLLITATLACIRLPEHIAFYLSQYAGNQRTITTIFRALFVFLVIIQFIISWRQG
ncbi:MAG: hypothetical protein A2021_03775 [Elusimicrobia bacterium GWF2_52_66]|nr:MAG: hypothetical protein A2X33_10060 [Elusimicrobia bacterium GWA2_51_34]OGR84707.1 MAG: hypothetical protein A2021_03775 [Elusimicrobia bacterium GWF2_52_66]